MHLIWFQRIFLNKMKIFTAMYFVETIVLLFAICYLNMCIYLLFVNIILLNYLFAKIFVKLFLQHNLYPGSG